MLIIVASRPKPLIGPSQSPRPIVTTKLSAVMEMIATCGDRYFGCTVANALGSTPTWPIL